MTKKNTTARPSGIVLAAFALAVWFAPPGACAAVLTNGDFSEGGRGWELAASHGARADFTIDAAPRVGKGRCAKVTVSRPTFTGWQIFLRSRVNLEGGRRYRVGFDVVADDAGVVGLCVQDANSPYRILLLAEVEAGAVPRTYSLLTPHVPQDGPMHVGFWFGNSPKRTFRLDDVSVVALSAQEMARLEALPEGFENGDFAAGLTGWELRTHQSAVADLSTDPVPKFADGNCAKVVVTRATETSWHIQLMQIFAVNEGKSYAATFSAAADAPASIVVAFQVPPPENEVLSTETVKVTTTPTTYTVTSREAQRDSDMKLTFHLGGSGEVTFWLDKVSVMELPQSDSEEEGGEPKKED